jgi:hypothetical protein
MSGDMNRDNNEVRRQPKSGGRSGQIGVTLELKRVYWTHACEHQVLVLYHRERHYMSAIDTNVNI